MKKKLLVLLFITGVLVTSFASSVWPAANALTARTDFSDRHMTASRGYSNICGDHICVAGEKSKWLSRMYELQREGVGKIGKGETYQDVLKNLDVNQTSGHVSAKMTEGMGMGGKMLSTNSTRSNNMTGSVPTGTK